MKVEVKINCDNAAFASDPAYEVSRILRHCAKRIQDRSALRVGLTFLIRDLNGNSVGHFTVRDSDK